MWEKNHLLMFKASLEWLATGKVHGQSSGMIRKRVLARPLQRQVQPPAAGHHGG